MDEILTDLIKDLNEVEEDPLSSQQLSQLVHSKGACMRHLGKICTEAQLNHTRELVVIEVVSRCAKLLIRDGLAVLAETEASPDELASNDGKRESKYTSQNVKKLILHYIH